MSSSLSRLPSHESPSKVPLVKHMPLDARSLPVFLVLSAAYLSGTLVRWLRWILFYVPFLIDGNYRWTPPHAIDETQLILMVIAPACVLMTLLYFASRRYIVQLRDLALLAVVLYLVTLVMDLDMSWFAVSNRHIGSTEIRIFLFENWQKYINVQGATEERLARRAGIHLAAYCTFVALSVWLPGLQRVLPKRIRAHLLAFVALLAVTDVVWANYDIANGNRQVEGLSEAHPLRTSWIDGTLARLGAATGLLGDVNKAFSAAAPNSSAAKNNPLAQLLPLDSAAGANIMVLAIEGFNIGYFDQLTALDGIRKTAIVGVNHFSTGDTTHLGLLGLSHGAPPFFYGDARKAQSKYIALFNENGYRTRRFGYEITQYAQIEEYSRNFSLPTVEPPRNNDWAMLDDISRYVTAGGKYVAIVYYFGTHWPYWHTSRFTRFQPEVPFDFDYSTWDLGIHRVDITNRYRNSLDELNDWLQHFLQFVDLQNTVLVIVGDHGEELLEEGRLTHSGGLWERAIRTPLLIHTPSSTATQVSSVTSHANILPAVAAAVGVLGNSSDAVSTVSADEGFAIAGHSNYTSTPSEWVFVRGPYKVLFGLDGPGHFIIHGVTDRSDRSVITRGLLADPAFLETLRAMKGVEQSRASLGGSAPPME
jgi:membrane-anchored protein YejM (alkaline phosphatase superfamily)